MRKFVILLLLIGILIPIHEHDEKCGYNPETNDGCKYAEITYQPNFKWPPEG